MQAPGCRQSKEKGREKQNETTVSVLPADTRWACQGRKRKGRKSSRETGKEVQEKGEIKMVLQDGRISRVTWRMGVAQEWMMYIKLVGRLAVGTQAVSYLRHGPDFGPEEEISRLFLNRGMNKRINFMKLQVSKTKLVSRRVRQRWTKRVEMEMHGTQSGSQCGERAVWKTRVRHL
jgi:hypothetical protein